MKKISRIAVAAMFLFAGTGAGFADNSYSRDAFLSLDADNKCVKDIFEEIEKQSEYVFFYYDNVLDVNRKVNLHAKDQTVDKILDKLFEGTNNRYVINDRQIFITRREAPPLAAVTIVAQQQGKLITGTVVDQTGEPVIGANIVEKGTLNGTVSDVDGKFTLTVSNSAILQISYVGYVSQEIAISSMGGGNLLSIKLLEDSQALSEVVVTGFGLSQRKATLTGAISTVGANDLSRSVSSTASGALAGKLSGVNFRQADGRPGATTSIQIRNMGTPLYVIDGVISDQGQFNNIDFNDIEAISILKDASASIYGVRAANGVVVVTTKKGKLNSRNTVTLHTYYGLQSMSSWPEPADATTYITKYIQSETVQGKTDYTYSKTDYEKWKQGTEKGYVPFDWLDFIFNTTPQWYANVNISGGSDKTNYYVSVGHINQDAMVVNYGGFRRTNVQMNIESRISNRFKMGATMNGRIETRVNPGVPEVDDYWMPRFGVYRNLPTKRPYANDNPSYPTLTSTNAATNFAWLNYELSGKYQQDWRVGQLQANAEYEIADGLKAKAMASYYFAYQHMNNQEYTYKLYGYDEATDTYPVIFENNNPWRERTTEYVEEMMSNVQLAYDKKFGDHSIAANIGFEATKRDNPSTWVHAYPTANSLHLIDYQIMDTYNDYGLRTQARLGWIGRLVYDYANKYMLEASARYDGSYKFPPGQRWGLFPSASLGWRISEEGFWQESKLPDLFSDFKIRGSYGLVGDDNVSDYADFDYLPGYNYKQGGSVINGKYVIGSQPRGLPVTTLSWLKATILDVGIDAAFLDNRLTGQADFFRRQRSGIPASRYDVLLPSETGFSLPRENLNSDVHMGYDLGIKWTDNVDELRYYVGGNVTYARFFDWEQYKPRFSNSWDEYRNSIYHRYGYLNWGLEAIGQFQSWEEIASYDVDNDRQGNKTLRPGDIKYKDVNGDKVINSLDERPVGYRQDSTPTLNFALNVGAQWKGFDLAIDLTGGGMSSWYQEWEQRNPFHDGGNNPQYYMEDTWNLSDIWDANSELIPGTYPMLLIGNSSHSNYWNSTFWKKNVRYVKLRNFELGYTVPATLLSKAGISGTRIYLSGVNLFTLTNVKGVDPEITETNGLAYPTTRIINLGINIKF